jgi:ATP-dependent helicase/nuclease subunit B
VVSSSANVVRHFFSWDRPLLPQAVEWFAGEWRGKGPLDLSRLLVVVPTRQSGRRLREALATHAAIHSQAVFPPRLLTPEALVSLNVGSGVASRLQSLLAWTAVFDAIDLDEFREVFPVDPATRNFAWKLRLAEEFLRLQLSLGENGLCLASVSEKTDNNFPEAARWVQLGELERLHAAELATRGLRDPQAARISAAQNPSPFPNVDKIVVLAAPDPLPLALAYLEAQARTLPVEVVVFAPPAEAAGFDAWGRPQATVWTQRELVLPDFTARVHLCANPASQAQRVADLAHAYTTPDGLLGVGVADPEVTPLLANALARIGIPSFNPEGRPRRYEGFYHLVAALAAVERESSFAVAEGLGRSPEFLEFLRERLGADFSAAQWLKELDELRAQNLPADLAMARTRAPKGSTAADGLALIEELRGHLASGPFSLSVTATLSTVFAARRFNLTQETDARFAEAASAWTAIVRDCAEAAVLFPRLTKTEWWELALDLYGRDPLTQEKPPGAVELQGWLELLWEDSPHVIVAGLNDGLVPDAVVGDAFLPETLRAQLGIKTNAARFARDAFMLQAITACRARTDWLFGKTSAAGNPLRPSRLLLRCRDEELPDRVAFLFRSPALTGSNLPWRRAWQLKPRVAAPPTRIRVTALRDYLRCPFRFYLRHVLRMEAIDAQKSELDAFDFGTLCHTALEQIGLQAALRDSIDARAIRDALWDEFDRAVRHRFGGNLTLPLVIQCESARQRLAKAAEVQARERAAGWLIEAVEKKIEVEISGLVITGKIDRIDRHLETGAYRVIDYKTSDTASDPGEAHLARLRPGEPSADWMMVESDDRSWVWADLQLPLYLHALALEFPSKPSVGYFNLPKAAGETRLVIWTDYSPELHAAAWRCAEGACAAIRAGKFWPPNETIPVDYDEFASLFHQGVAASVAWEKKR